MKNIRFTQSINLSVTVEVEVPDTWTDDDIHEFAKEWPMEITLSESALQYVPDDTVVFVGKNLDGAEITDSIIWN